ncbi:hypothetical protein B0H11DRAFT_1909711 [Mycena galericulata]|nr:hypothetical protein B0H11DRAFT_1909711 [Mycena galericulata]
MIWAQLEGSHTCISISAFASGAESLENILTLWIFATVANCARVRAGTSLSNGSKTEIKFVPLSIRIMMYATHKDVACKFAMSSNPSPNEFTTVTRVDCGIQRMTNNAGKYRRNGFEEF